MLFRSAQYGMTSGKLSYTMCTIYSDFNYEHTTASRNLLIQSIQANTSLIGLSGNNTYLSIASAVLLSQGFVHDFHRVGTGCGVLI